MFHNAKLRNFCDILVIWHLQKNFEAVDAKDTAVADAAAFAGGKQLHVAPAAVEVIAQGDAISEFEDFSC